MLPTQYFPQKSDAEAIGMLLLLLGRNHPKQSVLDDGVVPCGIPA